MTTTLRMTPVELSLLISQHAPREPGPCRVCGSTDMTIASMGGGEATKYVCGVAAAELRTKAGREYDEVAERHYRPSEQRITYHGDPEVVAALHELRALREQFGDDMTVPVGTVAFPNGHGKHLCYRSLRHEGGDRWVKELDWEYTHDPSHADLDVNAEEATR